MTEGLQISPWIGLAVAFAMLLILIALSYRSWKYEDSEGIFAAACITALIYAYHAVKGHADEFFVSPEMMVVVATISAEGALSVGRNELVGVGRRWGGSVIGILILACAVVRAAAAMDMEFAEMARKAADVAKSTTNVSAEDLPSLGVFVFQSLVWIAGFGFAFWVKWTINDAKHSAPDSQ